MGTKSDGGDGKKDYADLLATLPEERPPPAADPTALEELRTAVDALRREMAGLRKAVEARRTEPAGRDALDAWGEEFASRIIAATASGPTPASRETLDAWGKEITKRIAASAGSGAVPENGTAAALAEVGRKLDALPDGLMGPVAWRGNSILEDYSRQLVAAHDDLKRDFRNSFKSRLGFLILGTLVGIGGVTFFH